MPPYADSFDVTETSAHVSRTRRLLFWLFLVHAVMLGYGGLIHGPGWDEGGHLPSGISHWQLGNTDAYRVNPPLVRMVATLPLAFIDFDLNWNWSSDTVSRPEWNLGHQLWNQHGRAAYWYLTIARWVSIPWSLLAAYIIFQWGSQLYGPEAGLFAAVLWCFSPLVLTNAQMMTPDTGAAALGVAAAFAYWKFQKDLTWITAIDAGILLGLAELTKFTWVILFVMWPVVWIIQLLLNREKLTVSVFRSQVSQILRNLLPQYETEHLFRDGSLGLGQVSAQCLVHHGLVPGASLLGPNAKLIKSRVIDKDGDPRLPLLWNDGTALGFGKVVFSLHRFSALCVSRGEPKSDAVHRRDMCRQQPGGRLRSPIRG